MDAERLVLRIVDACGGRVEGRTYLQQLAYFVARELRVPMGYRRDYYGPYSRRVSAEVEGAVARGILRERREEIRPLPEPLEFDRVRYTYELTDDGREYMGASEAPDADGLKQLRDVVKRIRRTRADPRQLACAATVESLLSSGGASITPPRATKEARTLPWRLSKRDIEVAVNVLEELGIAARRGKQQAPAK